MIQKIVGILTKEIQNSLSIFFQMMVVCFSMTIVKQMQNQSENGVSEVAFYVCFLAVSTLIMQNFILVAELTKNTLQTLNALNGVLNPILMIYLALSGNITVSTVLRPTLFFMMTFLSQMSFWGLVPLVFTSTVLGLVGSLLEGIDTSKLSGFIKSNVMLFLEISLVIFVGLLSLEGSLANNVDAVLTKTSKTIISNSVPVVGKLIGDAAESVIGATMVSKSAIGFLGVLIMVSIVMTPLIKLLILSFIWSVGSSLIELFADKRIARCLWIAVDAVKMLAGILAMNVMMYLIQIGFLVKMKIS